MVFLLQGDCVCLDVLRGAQNGAWSTDGCTLLFINTSQITCQCNHLTNFALLLRVDSDSDVVSLSYALRLKYVK